MQQVLQREAETLAYKEAKKNAKRKAEGRSHQEEIKKSRKKAERSFHTQNSKLNEKLQKENNNDKFASEKLQGVNFLRKNLEVDLLNHYEAIRSKKFLDGQDFLAKTLLEKVTLRRRRVFNVIKICAILLPFIVYFGLAIRLDEGLLPGTDTITNIWCCGGIVSIGFFIVAANGLTERISVSKVLKEEIEKQKDNIAVLEKNEPSKKQ